MNTIHPTSIIGNDVQLGENNVILPYTIIYGPTEIGDGNIIGPHVVIGSPGADTRNRYYDCAQACIKIGDRNIIREFTAIQKPCYEHITSLGNDNYLMQSVHIPHDVQIKNNVVITAMCALGGVTKILEGANLGMGCSVSQFLVVGQYSIVATGAAALKNVRPFSRYIPKVPISVNEYAIKKFGFIDYMDEIKEYVHTNRQPTSPKLIEIIEEFNNYHQVSGKDMY